MVVTVVVAWRELSICIERPCNGSGDRGKRRGRRTSSRPRDPSVASAGPPPPQPAVVHFGRAAWGPCAFVAVFLNSPGFYVNDNRFEQYWNPGRRITRTFTIWDGSRGLGWVREEFWPGVTVPIGVFRYFGASPALAEHLWHATLLTIAGTGCVALLKCFRPRLGLEHLLAALVYMFGPFAATFLLPSNLFVHHALTPWLISDDAPGAPGGSPMAVRRDLRSARWARWQPGHAGPHLRRGALDVGVPVRGLSRATDQPSEGHGVEPPSAGPDGRGIGGGPRQDPDRRGSARRSASRARRRRRSSHWGSSWAESWRGLGFWVAYLRDASGPVRPNASPYMTSGWVVLLTFVPAAVGIGALWWSRHRRETVLFAAICVAGVFLMVGPHPADDPAPWGRGWLWTLAHVAGTATVRSTYKAGIGATLGLATLFGLGGVAMLSRDTDHLVSEPLSASCWPWWSLPAPHPSGAARSTTRRIG